MKEIVLKNIYGYDTAQNRLSNIIEKNNQDAIEEILEVNEDNQYSSITSNTYNVNILYDDNGNIIEYKDKRFEYDFLNRLIKVKFMTGIIARYYYDGENRRVEKQLTNGDTIKYIYHKNQVIQEYTNDTLSNTYFYGTYIDDPIAYKYQDKFYYYVKNNNYSIESILDSKM